MQSILAAFNKTEKPKRPYVLISSRALIPAPHYKKVSAGVRAVDMLAETLRARGYDVLVEDTNKFSPEIDDMLNRDAVVVYHEWVKTNYLKAKSFVQWVLGWWGQGGREWKAALDCRIRFYFCDLFNVDGVVPSSEHYKLTIDVTEHNLFNAENIGERTFNIMYAGKGDGTIMRAVTPEPRIEITNSWPETRVEVAYLLRRAKYLWIADATSAVEDEARLCGCPVIFVPNHNYSKADLLKLQPLLYGMSTGYTAEEIQKAVDTLPMYAEYRKKYHETQEAEINRFIDITQGI